MNKSTADNLPPDRSFVLTEQRNPRSMNLHQFSAAECVKLIHDEDKTILSAVEAALPEITKFIEAAEPRFLKGGRLIYVGAGTSGRLGVLDASEAPPTFHVEPGVVVGIIAGGDNALRRSSEGVEDNLNRARPQLKRLVLNGNDTLIGIAAGGTTAYVTGALKHAKRLAPKMLTAMLTCSDLENMVNADHLIKLETGPEVITGSTRMKAGTATKLVLNMISTTLMVRSGKVYQNLMVDLKTSNDKLRDRALRIIAAVTELDRENSFKLLQLAEGNVKMSIVMWKLRLSCQQAEELLKKHNGRLDQLLD